MLATAAGKEQDPKPIGVLLCCEELEDIRFTDALRLLIDLLKSIINETDAGNGMEIDKVIEPIISYLPNAIKENWLPKSTKLQLCNICVADW